jgi:molybdate transport system ATP-binding protein
MTSTERTLRVLAQVRRGHAGFALDVDLRFAPGITCVVGRSGAGKSTLLGVIAGLVRPGAGRVGFGDEVWFDATARTAIAVHQRRVAYVFQRLALFPHLDATHNVAYGMDRGLPRRERAERAHALLDRVGAAHLARRRPPTFSGGEAQRVALARALAMSPKVVLLDEPFSALDRELKIQLAALVRDLVDDLDVPLIYVTHSLGEARALADRAVRLEHGKVVAEGAPDEVLGPPHRGPATAAAGEVDADDDLDDPSPPGGRRVKDHDFEGTPMPEIFRRRG